MNNDQEEPLFQWDKIKNYLSNKSNLVGIAKTLIMYASIYFLFLFIAARFEITPESVQESFKGYGAFLIPVFIAAQLVASLTPLPDLPFNAGALLFFEPIGAFFIIWIGMWIGTIVNFRIARALGKDFIHRKYPQTAKWLDKFTGKYWFETIAAGRTFTLATFDLMAYTAGISTISIKKFGLASVLGLLPVALNSTLVGLAITSGDPEKTVTYTLVTISLAIAIGVIARTLRVRWEKTD